MSIAEKLTAIAENEQRVYDAGYEKGKSEGGVQHSDYINPEWTDWSYFNYKGARDSLVAKLKYEDTANGTVFSYMFYSDTTRAEVPKINTSKGTDFSSMYGQMHNVTTIPPIDTSNGTNFSGMFTNCKKLTTIPPIDTSNGTNFSSMFANCDKIATIPPLNLSKSPGNYSINGMFNGCYVLTDVSFIGTIPIKQNITSIFSFADKLTVDSLMSFVNALKNTGSSTYTVTIGATNLAKLTEEQIAVATAKNITLA